MTNPSALAKEYMEKRKMPLPIIDAHTHMGRNYGTYMSKCTMDEMVEVMDKENIEMVFCSPHRALYDPIDRDNEIDEAMAKYPDRFRAYSTYNPNYPELYLPEIEKVIKTPGYLGFKFLPTYHRYALSGENYRPVLEFANKHNLTILSHTWGNNDPHNGPRHIEGIAKEYKNIRFIMGHSAPGELDEAIDVAKKYENVWLDLCDIHRHSGIVDKMVAAIGADRIVFGTDMPWYDPAYGVGSVLFSKISDEDKYKILYKNAKAIADQYSK